MFISETKIFISVEISIKEAFLKWASGVQKSTIGVQKSTFRCTKIHQVNFFDRMYTYKYNCFQMEKNITDNEVK